MRRREPERVDIDKVPERLRQLDPERYREVALQALVDHPGDGWAAALAVWRHWQDDCIAWQAERGIVRGVKGWRKQLGPGRPPMAWVAAEFDVSFEGVDAVCPPNCRTHERWRRKHEKQN